MTLGSRITRDSSIEGSRTIRSKLQLSTMGTWDWIRKIDILRDIRCSGVISFRLFEVWCATPNILTLVACCTMCMNYKLILAASLGIGALSSSETQQFRTYVTPRSGETLAGPCIYQLTLPQANRPVRGVFVIFDRGWQIGNLYFDPAVFRFAAQHQLGLLLAQHCPSKKYEEIDVVPENGLGRALISALDQLASASQHPELSKSSLIYFGFSGAGSLTARMVEFAPERTIAAVQFAPGMGDPVGMDTVQLGEKARTVPQLIIANGADDHVGTARPYAYYAQYRKLGAPMTFLIQNRTPHCCVANIVPLMLKWLSDVVRMRRPTSAGYPLQAINPARGWVGRLVVEKSGVTEGIWHAKTWNSSGAEIEDARRSSLSATGLEIPRAPSDAQVPNTGSLVPAWLPSAEFAKTWVTFARQASHPIKPLE